MAAAVGIVTGSPRPFAPVVLASVSSGSNRKRDDVCRHIESRRYLIIVPVPVHHLTRLVSVEDSGLGHGEPHSPGDSTHHLIIIGQAVHDATALLSCEKPHHFNF